MEQKTIELFNNKAGHNKVYVLRLIPESDTHASVMGYNGKRGQQLTPQVKAANVPLEKALAKFDEVLKEKLSAKHGYEIAQSQAPAITATGCVTLKRSGFTAELPKDMPLEALERLIRDDRFSFERKRDGVNLSVRKLAQGKYEGINKTGIVVAIDPQLIKALDCIPLPTFLACGEWEHLGWFVWDIVEVNGLDIRGYRLEDRRKVLSEYFDKAHKHIHVLDVKRGEFEKRDFVEYLHSIRAEGVVAKLDAPFVAGESGNAYKIKFVAVGDVIVGPKAPSKEGKRSFGMFAFDGPRLRYLGSCGCPEKYEMPRNNQVVEIRYLYLHNEPDGHLIQPKFFGVVRNDKDAGDCSVATMKLKATN